MTFLYQLKQMNKITNYTFTFEFDENKDIFHDSGKMILGMFFIDYNKFFITKAGKTVVFSNNAVEWCFNFDEVSYGKELLINQKDAILKTEFALISGTIFI